jgi:hypothetical protein
MNSSTLGCGREGSYFLAGFFSAVFLLGFGGLAGLGLVLLGALGRALLGHRHLTVLIDEYDFAEPIQLVEVADQRRRPAQRDL